MDCTDWTDVAMKFSMVMAVMAVMAETVFCCPFYRCQQYRLLQCCPPLSFAFYSVLCRPVLNSQYKYIPYAQSLRLPILSGILIQEPGGIGSFGLPSHAAKYSFVSGA